jgi:predicted DNA-binding protein (MmcQ/YjbR family)
MNKRHWNSVYLDGTVPEGILYQMIDDSYDLVVRGLSRVERERIAAKIKGQEAKKMRR